MTTLSHTPSPIRLAGDWSVAITLKDRAVHILEIPPVPTVTVRDERAGILPEFRNVRDGWLRGYPLQGVRAEECTIPGALLPESLVVKSAPGKEAAIYCVRGRDYDFDSEWGTVWRLEGGAVACGQEVWCDYAFAPQRIDSAVLQDSGLIVLRRGDTHLSMPVPPPVGDAEVRLANFHLAHSMTRLGLENIFPLEEQSFPLETPAGLSPAEQFLPETMLKLRQGEPLRIVAWGDSVTGYNRYQFAFAGWLRSNFPAARIELITVAWSGKSSVDYLAEPPGSVHNFAEQVLARNPDLVISEFVNDASLAEDEEAIRARHAHLLAAFKGIGAEWIAIAPHYVKPDWMGLTGQRGIDDDPRLYVRVLREFCRENRVALADASRRYGRLWRQGIPFLTLMENGINHPNESGHRILADSLIDLFPATCSHQPIETPP